jgi:hypothetical protein
MILRYATCCNYISDAITLFTQESNNNATPTGAVLQCCVTIAIKWGNVIVTCCFYFLYRGACFVKEFASAGEACGCRRVCQFNAIISTIRVSLNGGDYMYYIYLGGLCFSTMEPLAFSGFTFVYQIYALELEE